MVWVGGVGCVQRRLTIRTDPPGAMVYVDGYPLGTTPISTDFIYYGTRQIRLVKDGYETVVTKQRIAPPWYQIPPLDFISENLVPGEIRDHRTLEFRLQPQRITPPEQLVDRAERLRKGDLLLPSGTGIPGAGGEPPSSPLGGASSGLRPPGDPLRAGGPPQQGGPSPMDSRPPVGSFVPPGTSGMDTSPPSDIGGRTVYPLPSSDGRFLP